MIQLHSWAQRDETVENSNSFLSARCKQIQIEEYKIKIISDFDGRSVSIFEAIQILVLDFGNDLIILASEIHPTLSC